MTLFLWLVVRELADVWKNITSEHFYQSDTSLIDALSLVKFIAQHTRPTPPYQHI
jgi:hypothetical protein